MNFVAHLNEDARHDVIMKCRETLSSRMAGLNQELDNTNKSLLEMTEKYENEKNCRKTAETAAADLAAQLEELQKSFKENQERVYELEAALVDVHSTADTKCLLAEDFYVSVDELRSMFRDAVKKNIVLHHEYVELESSYTMESENFKNSLAEALKKQEWLTTMYERQRQINESLSSESDFKTIEIQKQLDELKEQNAALLKTKDKVVVSAFRHQEASAKHRLAVRKLEHENRQLVKELQDARLKVVKLQNENSNTATRNSDNSDDEEPASERKDLKREEDTELPSKQDSPSSKLNDDLPNRRHRIRLCRVIQEGFQKLRDRK